MAGFLRKAYQLATKRADINASEESLLAPKKFTFRTQKKASGHVVVQESDEIHEVDSIATEGVEEEVHDEGETVEILEMSQSAAAHIAEFMPNEADIQRAIMGEEYHKSVGTLCACGLGSREHRCVDCSRRHVVCQACILKEHAHAPFHCIEKWNGAHFMPEELKNLGAVIQLGHDAGGCPAIPGSNSSSLSSVRKAGLSDIKIIDTNGIHHCAFEYCACIERPEAFMQLMQFGVFPATKKHPEIGFTFNVLREFHLHTNVSKKSAYDYLRALGKKTNNFLPSELKLPESQFHRIVHYWRYLTAGRRSGQLHGIDDAFLGRPDGSFVQPCLACPIPGFNLEAEPEKHYKNWKHISVDANFKLANLKKNNNLKDKALWAGRGLFRKEEGFDAHIEKWGHLKAEKSSCSNFAAIANESSNRGLYASGAVMLTCKHGSLVPDSAVNLQLGERHVNVDYAVAGALKSTENAPKVILNYDIGCQYGKNIVKRFTDCFPSLRSLLDRVQILVGKMHLNTHIAACQYLFSLAYTIGVGRTDGEEVERWWSEANQIACSTKYMNPGHRCDTIDDTGCAWNWDKLCNLGKELQRRLMKAQDMYVKKFQSFRDMDRKRRNSYTDAVVREWEEMDTTPYIKDGEVVSVYKREIPQPSKALVFERLAFEAARDFIPARSQVLAQDIRRDDKTKLVSVLYDGLVLQQRQWTLAKKERAKTTLLTDIRGDRKNLSRDIGKWRVRQSAAMPGVPLSLEDTEEPEAMSLTLPSSFTDEQRAQLGLETAGALEYELREGEAYDALENLRTALREVSAIESSRLKHGITRKKQKTTRNERIYKQALGDRSYWAAEYIVVRSALLALRMDPDHKILKRLDIKKDLYRPTQHDPHELGSGKKVDGWIWTMGRDRSDKNDMEWIKDDEKVQWFRARAGTERWEEELVIIHAEFDRLKTGLRRMAETWDELSKKAQDRGEAAYAAKKSWVYRAMYEDAVKKYDECDFGTDIISQTQALAAQSLKRASDLTDTAPRKRRRR